MVSRLELYQYRFLLIIPMIETADTDYAPNYDTDYEKPIMSRCFIPADTDYNWYF